MSYPEAEVEPSITNIDSSVISSHPNPSILFSRRIVRSVASDCPILSILTLIEYAIPGIGISGEVVTAPCIKRSIASTGLSSIVNENVY